MNLIVVSLCGRTGTGGGGFWRFRTLVTLVWMRWDQNSRVDCGQCVFYVGQIFPRKPKTASRNTQRGAEVA